MSDYWCHCESFCFVKNSDGTCGYNNPSGCPSSVKRDREYEEIFDSLEDTICGPDINNRLGHTGRVSIAPVPGPTGDTGVADTASTSGPVSPPSPGKDNKKL